MRELRVRLLNDFQRDFPLQPRPFARIAGSLQTTAERVLATLSLLQASGAVSRVGPVFRPNTVGASTLAAMAVPAAGLEAVAARVSALPQVNHNYQREHRFNLWFVVTAQDRAALQETLLEIQAETGYAVLSLPLLRDYHIDLGFRMQLDEQRIAVAPTGDPAARALESERPRARKSAEDFIAAVQDGLPLVDRPYREIGARLGWSEQAVIDTLQGMIDAGIIKRLGVVVRHHELGYRANAMVVWDVPDDRVDVLGQQLGRQDCVTLCYRRPRRLPEWRHNLFCMVHGRDRDDVLACVRRMITGLGLETLAHEVLFSVRRFKQRGAHYRPGH
ncbi:MAG: Lrp/AsnC family transcriptional regulator [Gammaproteobacteria bacterium]|jgi:DNA-binding Lrp family transcriptional regulator